MRANLQDIRKETSMKSSSLELSAKEINQKTRMKSSSLELRAKEINQKHELSCGVSWQPMLKLYEWVMIPPMGTLII